MLQKTQQINTRILTVIMAGVTSIGFATAALAVGEGLGGNANIGIDAKIGRSADAHLSPSGSTHSNVPLQGGAIQSEKTAAEHMSTKADEVKPSTDAELKAAGKATLKAKR
ncbi:MAG: hypothetical protein Q8K12_09470 [Thiobacillus sp.]|nr:hypothetical protein [Thiobacillus sp.]